MTGGILSLGKGRLSGACVIGDESVIILRTSGALRKKRLKENRQIIDDGIVSYARDCYLFPFGRLTKDSEVIYEIQN
ncbi:MAG: hypothetical protein IKC35_01640 [Clostridia bacterium]|nr:hypothetical protein [Clostridia bacterium]